MDELIPAQGLRDDAAIVAVQRVEIPSALRVGFPADPVVLAKARRLVRRWLRDRGAGDEEIAEITMAVNEACTNAIEHAYSPAPAAFLLAGQASGTEVTLSVRDNGRWRSATQDHRGRGLLMINAAMDSVEIRTEPEGTEIVMRRRVEGR
jgi:anti-sigma regulatory factor (Ser/Thr protein kinase)